MSDDTRTYQEPDDEAGFIQVHEWEDHRLEEEFLFLARLFHATAVEVAFRADHPEQRDGTGHITATDVQAYEAADCVADTLPNLSYSDRGD